MASVAGQKRQYSSSIIDMAGARSGAASGIKRRRVVQYNPKNLQNNSHDVEVVPQDPALVSGQLLRSITASLTLAGFDSVKPSALEAFRAMTEEYMLQLTGHVRTSMQHGRRTKPTALDFQLALSLMPNASCASMLKPQLSLHLPAEISSPKTTSPDPAPPKPRDLTSLLKPLLVKEQPVYIPRHFPQLPPNHAWKETPHFPERERDSKKMREKAMEEGQLAEAALRKLAAAHKHGLAKVERRRSILPLSGPGKARGRNRRKQQKNDPSEKDVFRDAMRELVGADASGDQMEAVVLDGDGGEKGADLGMPDGVVVNHNMAYWRRGGGLRG